MEPWPDASDWPRSLSSIKSEWWPRVQPAAADPGAEGVLLTTKPASGDADWLLTEFTER